MQLSRKTLCDWALKTAFALANVARESGRLRAGPVLALDDTPIQVQRPGPGGGKQKVRHSYLWTLTNLEVPGVAFRFTERRATEDVALVLVDGRRRPGGAPRRLLSRERVGCARGRPRRRARGLGAPMLRRFRDALKGAPRAMALYMKDAAELCAIERRARGEGMDADARLELRQRESLTIAARLMRLTSGWQEHYSLEGKAAEAMK